MKLFSTFSQKAPNKVFISIVLGALSGVSYAFLIPIVMMSLADHPQGLSAVDQNVQSVLSVDVQNYELAVLFFFTCLFILVARSISQITLIRISIDVIKDLREHIYRKIMKAPIRDLERMGSAKLVATIATDVQRIVMGARMLPDLLVNIVTLMGTLGFLLYLNSKVFVYVISAIGFGVVTYQIPMIFGNRFFAKARNHMDDLQEAIRGLIYGAKELKLAGNKSDSYFNDVLLKTEKTVLDFDKKGFTIVRAAMNYGDLISFFVIGFVTYIFINYHSITSQELIGTIMALLYVTAPVAVILSFIPQIFLARVSLRKVNALLDEIPSEDINETVSELPKWQTIKFDNVHYQYSNSEDRKFAVGPVSFEIEKGEITFLIGGNGSGKSTLAKVISLYYQPSGGRILFGNTEVNSDTLKSCRERVSAIFTDFYLFDRILGVNSKVSDDVVNQYLKELKLEDKVTVKNGNFSTIHLSDGQRKRLALLIAFLDDNELYLFDEWAADQDPMFKDVFYYQILPNLKAQGKAIVVISHDDRYFDIADKTIVLNEGKLSHIEYGSKAQKVS
ncbi:cyclic peptide export ABC transporter [Flocculibacter collagenilyticus]|uniref:cyclic peptide export ABC transporter n=1 Tax=Flocculibacter collagenilyticus TaxID=2744479 RepID=UPI0018F4B187|nr:cyclic peptide export ABC transporter [Flocculibacter collagenilyticus]